MATITLHSGQLVQVDETDLPLLSQYRWYLLKGKVTDYAQGHPAGTSSSPTLMHRLLMPVPPGFEVDHHNGDGLDNRRCNLRQATRSQNNGNRRGATGRSGYRGVSWHRGDQKWHAAVYLNNRRRHLGVFADPWEAAQAYNAAALEQWGEFARVNVRGSS